MDCAHTFVFVPGAWHGAWCFRDVERRLRGLGHAASSLTLTGLGDRAHLMHPGVGLETHVADVVAVLDTEELRDVVLIGHSYAGAVIALVAERRPQALAALIFLDAVVPVSGEAVIDHFPPPARAAMLASAIDSGAGPMVPIPTMEFLGVDASHAAWVARRLTPHPLRTGTDPIVLHGTPGARPKRIYVDCDSPPNPTLERSKTRIGGDEWTRLSLHTGHDPFISDPVALAELLDRAARSVARVETPG